MGDGAIHATIRKNFEAGPSGGNGHHMRKQILITGGAGFVGSHLADGLLAAGHSVRVLDDLAPQVHPAGPPDYLSSDVELITGDVRDPNRLKEVLTGVDVVFHFAATVGVGQ